MFKTFWKNVLKSLEKDEEVLKKRQDEYKKRSRGINIPLDLFLELFLGIKCSIRPKVRCIIGWLPLSLKQECIRLRCAVQPVFFILSGAVVACYARNLRSHRRGCIEHGLRRAARCAVAHQSIRHLKLANGLLRSAVIS